MKEQTAKGNPPRWPTLLVALALAAGSFALQGRVGINIADEGFLWYGVQRTVAGDVPLRDFQSYDPGRYYWCAGGAKVFGPGLVALRFSEALAQFVGLWLGLLSASRLTRNWIVLGAIGFMLTIWMFPSHKVIDHTFLLAGIWLAMRMVERPSLPRVTLAGLFVGLCTFFGRNHALYNGVAQCGLLFLLWARMPGEMPLTRIVAWILGVLAGLIPLLVMLIFVPGFLASYQESIQAILQNGTNLKLPIPWPWQVSDSGPRLVLASRVLLGLFFIALPLFYAAVISCSLVLPSKTLRQHPLFFACGFVGLTYAYHAFSRADFSHLAQSIHPFTLGILAALALLGLNKNYFLAVAAGFIALALIGFGREIPLYQRIVSPAPWIAYDAGGTVYVPSSQVQFYDCLRDVVGKRLGRHETLLLAPFSPGLYPLLDRPSPVWEVFYFFPASQKQQREMIGTLATKKVDWAVISDATVDEREDLRFSATHDLIWRYLVDHFEPVPMACLPSSVRVFHRRKG